MTSYQFPRMKDTDKWDIYDQFAKIKEEVNEAEYACGTYGYVQLTTGYASPNAEIARDEYLMELVDIIHCVETALRIEDVTEDEYEEIKRLVIEKNRKRGYYDD